MLLIVPSAAPFLHAVNGLRESQRFGHCLIWGEKLLFVWKLKITLYSFDYSGKWLNPKDKD
jgi:hypothetical protein